jgi:hypothetical protein
MFEGWGNFFVVLGTAAAALIGVMALVATLTAGGARSSAERGQRLYLTPTVFHLAAVLTLSTLTLAPRQPPAVHLLMIMALTLYGLGYAAVVAVQLSRAGPAAAPHWSDFWCYGAIPVAVYTAIALALLLSFARPGEGCFGFAAGLLALLLAAIRNAWDLVTWLAPRREPLNHTPDKLTAQERGD